MSFSFLSYISDFNSTLPVGKLIFLLSNTEEKQLNREVWISSNTAPWETVGFSLLVLAPCPLLQSFTIGYYSSLLPVLISFQTSATLFQVCSIALLILSFGSFRSWIHHNIFCELSLIFFFLVVSPLLFS